MLRWMPVGVGIDKTIAVLGKLLTLMSLTQVQADTGQLAWLINAIKS